MSRRRYFADELLEQWFTVDAQTPLADLLGRLRQLKSRTASGWIDPHNWVYDRRNNPGFVENETLAKALESGRSYLVGEGMTAEQFRRRCTSSCLLWQRMACLIAHHHPDITIEVSIELPPLIYKVYWRGPEYVEIGLPHQEHGGEKHWVCPPPFKRKTLVNVD
jgi:hypothetical protein